MTEAAPPGNREAALNGEYFTNPWFRFFTEISKRIGAGFSYSLGGRVTTDTTSVGSVGTGEDDLITFSLQKNTMVNIGDTLEIKMFGSFGNTANTRTLKLYLGSTLIFSLQGTTTAFQNREWSTDTTIIRTGAATQSIVTSFSASGNFAWTDVTSATEDFTTALTIKATGEGVADNDILQAGLLIKFFPIR